MVEQVSLDCSHGWQLIKDHYRQIFPGQSSVPQRPMTKDTALARIKERRAVLLRESEASAC
jgi:hypothetical protein